MSTRTIECADQGRVQHRRLLKCCVYSTAGIPGLAADIECLTGAPPEMHLAVPVEITEITREERPSAQALRTLLGTAPVADHAAACDGDLADSP